MVRYRAASRVPVRAVENASDTVDEYEYADVTTPIDVVASMMHQPQCHPRGFGRHPYRATLGSLSWRFFFTDLLIQNIGPDHQ